VHTENMMSVEPNDYMRRRTDRISIFQVGFEASSELNDAMHRFLLEKFQQDRTVFRSYEELRLPVHSGGSDGLRHDSEGQKAIDQYDKRIRSLGSVPIAIMQARTVMVERGDIQVNLLLSLTREQRRQLGGQVLRHLDVTSTAPLAVYARLSSKEVRPEGEVRSAALALRRAIADPSDDTEASRYYVARPHVLVRSGSRPGARG
jgi:hypothetical protein